jgi:glycosyltransferase involved in cell wall biosynthesis
MKIAIISPSILPVPAVKGGAIETLIQLFIDQNEIESNNLEIVVISAYDKRAANISKGYKKTSFQWITYHSAYYYTVNFVIRAIRKALNMNADTLDILLVKHAIRKQVFDKVIVEGNTLHAASLAKIVDKDKLYFHVHSNVINRDSKTNEDIIAGCNKIIVVSKFIKSMIMNATQATEGQIRVLMNCIDLSSFETSVSETKKDELRSRYSIRMSDIVILFAGRIVVEKGIVELIDALDELPKHYPFKLLVIGSFGSKFGGGDSDYSLRKRLDKISGSIREKIIYTGFIQNSEIHFFHCISDIAVVPSISEEGAGLVAIEAMASGLPLVVTNSGGMPEYVNDDCAIVINRDENLTRNLALSLEKLILDKELRHSMGVAGNKQAQQLSRNNYYEQFLDILS